jgi:acid phosphatase
MADPYFGSLAKKHKGNLLSDYYAITHPSEPNYIAMIGGSTFGNIE